MDKNSLSHTTWECKYHLVFAPKYCSYVITDVERKRKFVCVDPHDMPIIAVVDPEMMSSMPKGLTASTGMDALTHAIEGYTPQKQHGK